MKITRHSPILDTDLSCLKHLTCFDYEAVLTF